MESNVRSARLFVWFDMGAKYIDEYSKVRSARELLPAAAGPCITLPAHDNISPDRLQFRRAPSP